MSLDLEEIKERSALVVPKGHKEILDYKGQSARKEIKEI